MGSFNNYCGNNYEAIVLTIETNRQLNLSRRIEQQLAFIEILFKPRRKTRVEIYLAFSKNNFRREKK